MPHYESSLNDAVHSYRKGRNILSCAKPHCNQDGYLMHFDIVNFFGSIPVQDIFEVFMGIVGDVYEANEYTNMVIYREALPQGTCVSNELSNMAFTRLDNELSNIAARESLVYTRYSDDLFFSQHEHLDKYACTYVKTKVENLLRKNGYKLNPEKHTIRHNGQRKEILGLVVNGTTPSLKGEYLRTWRQLAYDCNRLKLEGLFVPPFMLAKCKRDYGWIRLVMPDYARRMKEQYTWLDTTVDI